MKVPFSVYDFFGYLASGYLVLVSVDLAFSTGWVLVDSMPVPRALAWVLAAYVAGHLVAHLSSVVLEGWLVRNLLGSPEEHMLGIDKGRRLKWLFPGNAKTLPEPSVERIKARASSAGVEPDGRAFFHHCHALVKNEDATRERLTNFLKLYGFCRNLAAGFFAAALVFMASCILTWLRTDAWSGELTGRAIASLVLSVGMLYRYLKFFRHFTGEVLLNYAELPVKNPEPDSKTE